MKLEKGLKLIYTGYEHISLQGQIITLKEKGLDGIYWTVEEFHGVYTEDYLQENYEPYIETKFKVGDVIKHIDCDKIREIVAINKSVVDVYETKMKENEIIILNPTESFMSDAAKAGYKWISNTSLDRFEPMGEFALVSHADMTFGYVGTDKLKEYLNTHSNEIERIYNLEVDYQLPLLYDRLDIPLTISTNITNESADDLFIKVQLENTTSAQVYSNDSRVMLEINACDTDNEYEVSNNYFEFTNEEFKKFAQIVQTMKESLEL